MDVTRTELPEPLAVGWWYHQTGDFARAEKSYREFLRQHDHAGGWSMLGLVYVRTRRFAEAVQCFERSISLRPDDAGSHSNLGVALAESGRLDEAISSFRHASDLNPQEADAKNNLGAVLARAGRLHDAVQVFRRAVEQRPRFAEAITNLGAALAKLGQLDEAVARYREALELKPDHPETLNNIGSLLLRMQRPSDAEPFLIRATQLRPQYAEAHNNLGLAKLRQDNVVEAVEQFGEALRLKTDYTDAERNLGIAQARAGLWLDAANSLSHVLERRPQCITSLVWLAKAMAELGQPDQAEQYYRRAIALEAGADGSATAEHAIADRSAVGTHNNQVASVLADLAQMLVGKNKPSEALAELRKARELDPSDPYIVNKLGAVLWSLRRFDEAAECFELAISLKPDYADAHLNRSHYLLQNGDYETGLAEYEWRLKIKGYFPDPIPEPRWDGGPLDGRPIVLHSEQGLGDMLMALRFVPLVKERGGYVIYQCLPPLRALLAGFASIDELVATDAPTPADAVHAAMMSLPMLFRARANAIPGATPYLAADPMLVEYWRRELDRIDGFRVGIVWQGNPRNAIDRYRSVPLRAFELLALIPGVRLISLQKGQGCDQLSDLPVGMEVVDWGRLLDERGEPFTDTAAVLCGLDLVITIDTAVGHLAGSLGVPVWIVLGASHDWRWMRDRHDTAWYPTARLYCQQSASEWRDVFERMAADLADMRPVRRPRPSIVISASAGEVADEIARTRVAIANENVGALRDELRRRLQTLQMAQRRVRSSAELDRLARELEQLHEQLRENDRKLDAWEQRDELGGDYAELACVGRRLEKLRRALITAINEHAIPSES